ncbi:hypothetical protein ELI02_34235 [Rhizobium leguminosarum]|uniref:Uncharacterized protein n=1 Tax=Rhizobium leguminosarum TaxID=384 RepID=A0A4Q8XSH3_RHILE|nr:hypothetical protein ELI31_28950 [Rhizobium leguminosarum]TAV44458.1 hypothetical protein ELI32_30295 [Rhizobium leguminosarum]TAV62834.1 hypothetical protein ELI30_30030 [Rhizobium leguminosarum]TAX42844.1 hypothetical protein ELI02_34235 [Rhizobium leguminosarum]TAX47914.1 hypothetical protein ELI01_27245 [Rhizobium leguminosarum]
MIFIAVSQKSSQARDLVPCPEPATNPPFIQNMVVQGRCVCTSLEVFSVWISGQLLFGAGAVPIAEMDTTIAVTAEKNTSA